MKLDIIDLPSYWGTELRHKHIRTQEQNHKLAVLFPGQNYPCNMPPLHYARSTAIQAGYDVLLLEYGYQAARLELNIQDLPKVIDECVASIQQIITPYRQVSFISKSLGTVVAGESHRRLDRSVKHIYLTPLVDALPYINSSSGAVIYGGNDHVFCNIEAEQIILSDKRTIIEIPHADHALEAGDVIQSLSILSSIVDIYKNELIHVGLESNDA